MNTRLFILIGISFLAIQCKNKGKQENTEPVDEQNWVWLFDGSSTDHWRDTKSDQFPEHGWLVEDDVLTVLGKTEDHPAGHDIITKKLYSNFELELEARMSEGANSGIKYIVTDSISGHEGSFLGLEYQLIDNERHADAKKGRNGNRKMGALYDLISPPESMTINPPGEWNKIRIIVDGDHVEQWFNDVKIIEFERKSLAFRELVALSKYNEMEKFGEFDQGHILLQGHGNTVSFRAIKIRTW
ncbi:DUF1080 domain-containing protein [Bacteroidota bacterium]